MKILNRKHHTYSKIKNTNHGVHEGYLQLKKTPQKIQSFNHEVHEEYKNLRKIQKLS